MGGLQCQFLGRKKSLVIDSLFVFASYVGLGFSPNFISLLVCRFLLGHSVASLVVNVPAYTGEICQAEVRMVTGSFLSVCMSGGMTSMLVIGAMLSWRSAVLIMSALPIVTIFLVAVFVPESPIWLAMHNRIDDARASLTTLRGNQLVIESELRRIQSSLEEQRKEEYLEKEANGCCSGFKEIFDVLKDTTFLKPFSFLLFIFCVGLEWTGLPAIAFYMVGLLIEADIPFDPYLVAAGIACYRWVLLVIFSSGIAKRVKRRPLFIITAIAMIFGNAAMGTYFLLSNNKAFVNSYPYVKWVPVIAIFVIYTAFGMGYGTVPYMLQGEILPPYARAIGSGLLGFFCSVSLFISAKMGPTISEIIGNDGAFYLYTFGSITTAVFAFFQMPETFNLSLEEIEKLYQQPTVHPEFQRRLRKTSRKRSSMSIVSFYEIATPYNK